MRRPWMEPENQSSVSDRSAKFSTDHSVDIYRGFLRVESSQLLISGSRHCKLWALSAEIEAWAHGISPAESQAAPTKHGFLCNQLQKWQQQERSPKMEIMHRGTRLKCPCHAKLVKWAASYTSMCLSCALQISSCRQWERTWIRA